MLEKLREILPRSLATTALMFGGVACSSATAGTSDAALLGINAFIGLVASLATNIAATDFYRVVVEKLNHESVLANDDLIKAISDTILTSITFTANKPQNSHRKEEILLLTKNTSDRLQKFLLGEAQHAVPAARKVIDKLSDQEIVDIFTADPRVFGHQKSPVPVEAWEELVMWLAIEENAVMSLDTTRVIATDLHEHFPRFFLEIIKYDFSQDGQAYVALQNQIYNRLLAGQQEIFAAVSVVSQQIANMDQKLVHRLDEMPGDVAREFEKLLSQYEAYKAESEAYKRSQKELKVLSLKDSLKNHLIEALNNDHGNTFYRKYVPSTIYFDRKDIAFKFRDFLAQSQQRCFVAIGHAGMGKTCLCCKLAESLALQNPNYLPLLISSESIRLFDRDGDELKTAISQRLRSAVPAMADENEFEVFCRFLKANELHLVVFLDGLNELQGNSYSSFNTQFARLVELIHNEDFPVHFVLTCRHEWWQYFSAADWADKNIYSKLTAEQATVVLESPSEKEVKQLSEKYFDYFAINGELSGEAITTCQNLLMLRLLCDAYTNRPINNKDPNSSNIKPYDLKVVSSLKKKEILKRYVAARREAFVEFVRNSDTGVIDTAPSNIYFLTTFYIINIANFMYQKRRASITADEVYEIAAAIHHPDATLGRENISSSSKSFFLRLIDLGIFSRSDKDAREFSFVYETYFEFSLGRYIAFVRWHNLTGGTFAPGPIEADLENLIAEHAQQSHEGDFSNLFGAIQFAVLATEAGDWINWADLPAAEGVYKKHPRLFSHLVGRLANAKEFDWLQQACAIIRETELAKIETWSQLETQNGHRAKAREQFGELLEVLDKLATTTDFVLLWDIENTLKTLAQANLGLTIEQLKRWAESDNSLKIVFAAQVVSALARDNSERVLGLLLEWIQNQKFRSNFWLIRSLLFAISEFTRANYQRDLENNSDWLQLRREVYKLLDSDLPAEMSPYIRSRALSLLPNLSLSQVAELNRIDGFIEKRLNEHDSWQLLNLVFNLTDLPNVNHRVEEWIFKTLDQIATHPNHHLWYAIEKLLDSIESSKELSPETLKIRAEIEEKYDGRRWRTNVEPRIHKFTNQIGIVYTPRYLEPDYENHPECRERLIAIINKLEQCGEENFVWITPREADTKELKKVHNVETDRHRDRSVWGNYIETIAEASRKLSAKEEVERIGASELRFESFETAKMAAGGVIKGIDYVLESDALAAFVLNRPPGHLANNTICIFNNIAVGAFHALRKMKRILIVDCDAHHGKHTQKVFYRSPNVLYFSMHIDGDYAREDGMIRHVGDGPGKGYTFNIPYPPNLGDEGYEVIINNLLLPVALDFKPELILVSAGFDGHFDDPLTPVCRLSEQSYINLARLLRQIAELNKCKIVGSLEGGYALTAMPNSLAHMLNIWGDWNLEGKIGYTPKPSNYSESLNPAALNEVRELIAKRVELMHETKKSDNSYFFDPTASHWQDRS